MIKPLKVGILTFHFSDNYGASLQAYALRRWFAEQGHLAQFIDYRPAHIEHGGRLIMPTSFSHLKADVKVMYLAISSFIKKHFGNQSQKEKFESFRKIYLDLPPNIDQSNWEASLASSRIFDLIVAGSDQIWSPSEHHGFDPNYFLAFARNFPCRRVSYAASFGRDKLSPSEAEQLPDLLANFDAVSVRETSGVTIAEEAGVVSSISVPDPTLLHRDYEQLIAGASTSPASPYVFCYALRTSDNIRQTTEQVASVSGIQTVLSPHNPHRRWLEIGKTVYPDPAEWLALLKNARFVVTNSFHGTVFSLLFKRPFIVAGLTGDKAKSNSRSLNLLRSVDLEDRFIASFSRDAVNQLISRPIDWTAVDGKLSLLRATGEQFLLQQLEAAGR